LPPKVPEEITPIAVIVTITIVTIINPSLRNLVVGLGRERGEKEKRKRKGKRNVKSGSPRENIKWRQLIGGSIPPSTKGKIRVCLSKIPHAM